MKKFLRELRSIFNANESMTVDTEMLTTVTEELRAARSLIDGVASCGSCGACSGAAQRYLKEGTTFAPVCKWSFVITLRGLNRVWAWQAGCNEELIVSDVVSKFVVCPFCSKSLVQVRK